MVIGGKLRITNPLKRKEMNVVIHVNYVLKLVQ